MKHLNITLTALYTGVFLACWHLFWSILVLTSVAQQFLNFVFWAHMIKNPYTVTGFSLVQSTTLILFSFVIGSVIGALSAWLWNIMYKGK